MKFSPVEVLNTLSSILTGIHSDVSIALFPRGPGIGNHLGSNNFAILGEDCLQIRGSCGPGQVADPHVS